MAIPNFFSVERKGYTKVSDLFYDVMQDMLEHGFTFVNCSNASKDKPLTFWKPTIINGGTGKSIGDKLYILDGTRPTYAGTVRPAPYVQVTSVSNGAVTGVSEVISSYDFPIWTSDVLPETEFTLSSNVASFVSSNVKITLANITAQSDRTGTIANVSYAPSTFSFTLEASGDVDPLNGTVDPNSLTVPPVALANTKKQPWRIQFVVPEEQKASAAVATKLQMAYDDAAGKIKISQITDDIGNTIDNVGVTGAQQAGGIFVDTDLNQGLYNRKIRVANQPQTYPLSYVLSITNRGFFLGIYEGSWSTTRGATTSNSNYFNWILVQRPVDRGTGRVLTAGKAPVFHINSVNYKYYKAVVRESDILHPTSGPLAEKVPSGTGTVTEANAGEWLTDPKTWKVNGTATKFTTELTISASLYTPIGQYIGTVKSITNDTELLLTSMPAVNIKTPIAFLFTPPGIFALRTLANEHTPDSHAIFNSVEQVSLTEDKTYLLSFPHNLTTPRYRYTEELDMIGTTSSDVVMSGQDIQFKTYGEPGPRTYRALPANGPLNTGLRVAVLFAPQGPRWTGPGGEVSPFNAGDIDAVNNKQVSIPLQADPVPVLPGESYRALPTFRLERGSLPSGLSLEQVADQWEIRGTVNPADYTEDTVIKFTIAAVNHEDSGYSLRDFYFTYRV